MKKTILVLVSLLMVTIGVAGCALSKWVTPTELDKPSVEYVVERGVADANDYKPLLYPNLAMAEKLKRDVTTAFRVRMHDLEQEVEDEQLKHSIRSKAASINVTAGLQREQLLFGETGILSMILPLVGLSGCTGLLGLMRKRPGDMTPADLNLAVATATGKTTEELSAKEKQFAQVISGVSEFMKTYDKNGNAAVVEDFKKMMNEAQDKATRQAVALAKVG